MAEKRVLVMVLISIIIILCCIVAYGVYTGFKVKAEISRLNEINQNLTSQLNSLQENYGLLVDDVAEIYKTCIKQNVCKGRYPKVRWYCNDVGDEVSNPSHICFCDSSCELNATEI